MKNIISIILFTFLITVTFTQVSYSEENANDIIITNKFFSLVLPYEAKGLYKAKITKDSILIYDKVAKKSGFGGFAFGLKAYKNPKDHAMMPGGRKLGELENKKGVLFDMVLLQPTDVQYNYTKSVPPSYRLLYNLGNEQKFHINGYKNTIYYHTEGTMGEYLYKDVLQKHLTAIKEKWNSKKLEEENMSYMYNVIALSGKNPLDVVGYTYYDSNGDGIDELFIGEILKGSSKGIIYDIYTMIDRKPAHVISGGNRNRFFACDDAFICNETLSGANEKRWLVYILVENSTELFPQVGFKYDAYQNKNKPWFISYNFLEEDWDNVSKEKFDKRKKVFERYERFDFKPLRDFK